MEKIAVLVLVFTSSFMLTACGEHNTLEDVVERVVQVEENESKPILGETQRATFDRYNLPAGGLHLASGSLRESDFDLSISGCRGGAVFQGQEESMLCPVSADRFDDIGANVSDCQWSGGGFLSFENNNFIVSDRGGENFYALRFSQADENDFSMVLVEVKPLAVDLF